MNRNAFTGDSSHVRRGAAKRVEAILDGPAVVFRDAQRFGFGCQEPATVSEVGYSECVCRTHQMPRARFGPWLRKRWGVEESNPSASPACSVKTSKPTVTSSSPSNR